MRPSVFALCLGVSTLFGCSKTEKSPEPARTAASTLPVTSASAGATNEPETVHTRLVECKWTGRYTESFGENVAEIECTSHAPKPLKQVTFWIYYYDKDQKLLERFLNSLEEGSGTVLEPGATKKLALGKSRGHEPIQTRAIEVEASRGTYTDGTSWQNPELGLEERSMAGPIPSMAPPP